MQTQKSIAILGSGPAALMAADVISEAGHSVTLFEKRKAPGRKLLIAGSSGLNITNALPLPEFVKHYTGPKLLWKSILNDFTPQDWIQFIEDLGIKTFLGTSGRYFVEDMKASKFLRAWINRLTEKKVHFYYDHECVGFLPSTNSSLIPLQFNQNRNLSFDAVCFCLGGGSYEPTETPLRWPFFFKEKGIGFEEFASSNVGYQVSWSSSFLKEAEGLPLKNIELTSSRGSRKGDLVITSYGIEGTPIYFSGEVGTVQIDLKPDLNLKQIISKLTALKENLSPIRRVKKQLNLCPAALALLFHQSPESSLKTIETLAPIIKRFPIQLNASQPLTESISSQGGIHLSELNEHFMFHQFPGVFAAGEMLNWDAPTGGFLIQGCVSQGYRVGQGILQYLKTSSP